MRCQLHTVGQFALMTLRWNRPLLPKFSFILLEGSGVLNARWQVEGSTLPALRDQHEHVARFRAGTGPRCLWASTVLPSLAMSHHLFSAAQRSESASPFPSHAGQLPHSCTYSLSTALLRIQQVILIDADASKLTVAELRLDDMRTPVPWYRGLPVVGHAAVCTTSGVHLHCQLNGANYRSY